MVVASGAYEGWDWLLSASPDGVCVALTDEQGSDTICPTASDARDLPGYEKSADIIGVAVRSPRPPGPDVVFLFGRVSPRVDEVGVQLGSFDVYDGSVYRPPSGIDTDDGLFLVSVPGYPYPVVPTGTVLALGRTPETTDVTPVPRPSWATEPYTVLAVIASGTLEMPDGRRPWEITVYRSEVSGELCVGLTGHGCDPVEPTVDRPDDLFSWEVQGSEIDGKGHTLIWGRISDFVDAVRMELDDGRVFEGRIYPPPAGFPQAGRIFVVQYAAGLDGQLAALDANGNVRDSDRISE